MEFGETSEFAHDLKRLRKKYLSLDEDVTALREAIEVSPSGDGAKHCNCMRRAGDVIVYKIRLACRYLQASRMRVIYAHHVKERKVVFIELYYKGEHVHEDGGRITAYLKSNMLQ